LKYSPDHSFISGRCSGCGICERGCPTGAVSMRDNTPVFNETTCIGCAHCGAYCPENCFDLVPLRDNPASPESLRALMDRRRSVRRFTDQIVSEETQMELLSVVGSSPTGVNAQRITVVAYGRKTIEEEILASVRRKLRLLAPTGIPALAGFLSGRGKYIKQLAADEDVVFHGAPLALYFYVPKRNPTGRDDGIIAAASVMYHAESMGLGTLWNGVAERIAFLSSSVLGSHRPRGTRLTAVLCIGYPALLPLWKAPERDWDTEAIE